MTHAPSGRTLATVVFALLGASAVALVLVAVGLMRQASPPDPDNSLDYQTLLTAIDEIIQLTGDQQVLRFDEALVQVGRQSSSVDTLVIAEAGRAIPSLGPGGFLHTEVQRYNAFQRERVALAADDPDSFERLAPYNPSLFRSFRKPDGTLGVARTASAWNRRVRSPFGDRWSGDVHTGDASESWSLYNAEATVPLDRAVRLRRRVDGRLRSCDFQPQGDDAEAFCLSEARTPQLTLRGVGTNADAQRLVAGWAATPVDGERLAAGDSSTIQSGSLVQIDPLGDLVFGQQRHGVLSTQQWINGRMRRRSGLRPPLDLVSTLGRGPIDPKAPPEEGADVVLSVSAEATLELTEQLDAFVGALPIPIEFATAVVARASDGQVVALGEVGTRSAPGRSRLLERIVPGSAVKPIIAAAVLSQQPSLGSLTIPARSGLVRSVGNAPAIPVQQAFRTALNCGSEDRRVDLRTFLRCSNNEYAATLLLRGLTRAGASVDPVHAAGAGNGGAAFTGRSIDRGTLLRSAFTEGMNQLFDVSTDPTIVDASRRSASAWSGLVFTDGTAARVPFEALPDASRPALLGDPEASATDLGLLYRYSFGAWENRWNLFDLTTAFGRVVTDRRIRVTMASTGTSAPVGLELSDDEWYSDFLAGLAGVARDGTAAGLARRWRAEGLPGTVFAKTGTLAEEEARRGSGLFIKSLLFAVGETEDGPTTALTCGLVGSVYFVFKRGPNQGSLPSYQVDFAERRLARFLAEHWQEFGACPEESTGVARSMGTG